MKNVMLIDVESVKKLGYVHENILPDVIATTIRRVQHVMLRKVMGVKEYNALLDKVSNSLPPTVTPVPLDAATKELIDDYIQPYLVACVDFRILMPLTYRSRSKSVGKGEDENHQAVSKDELIALKDQMARDVDAFRETLVEKLFEMYNSCEDGSHKGHNVIATTPTNSIKFR